MKRDDVKKILPNITDDELSAVMGLHGSSVQGYKETILGLESSLQQMEETIKERDLTISSFGETDLEKLKKEEYERAYMEANKEFNEYKKTQAIDGFLKSFGARNIAAVKALISMDGVGFENDTLTGLDEQVEKIVKENPFLFEAAQSAKPAFTSQIEGGNDLITKDAFQKLGYHERLKLYNDNPTLYMEMNN